MCCVPQGTSFANRSSGKGMSDQASSSEQYVPSSHWDSSPVGPAHTLRSRSVARHSRMSDLEDLPIARCVAPYSVDTWVICEAAKPRGASPLVPLLECCLGYAWTDPSECCLSGVLPWSLATAFLDAVRF